MARRATDLPFTSPAITVDNRCMASLPALRTFSGLHRTPAARLASSTAPLLATKPDPKAVAARRLRAQDRARRTTSVAPPAY
jgi:hypothetical protein